MDDEAEIAVEVADSSLPDYPPVMRHQPERLVDGRYVRIPRWLIHTRKQAEAGKVIADAVRIPYRGKVT